MDKEKIIHALKLANECTYADVMMDSAKDYLRNKLNEALLEIEQPTKQVSVPSEENKYHFARELLFTLKSNGVPIPEQTYLYWIEKLIQDEKTYQSQPMKQADVSGSYIYLVHDCDRSSVLSAHLTEESAEKEVTELRKGFAPSVTFDIQKVEVK